MAGWKEFGSVISDPWEGDDTPLWTELLKNAAEEDSQLYVKLIGLRYAGAVLVADRRFRYRLAMANAATIKQQDVRELLAPHKNLLINLLMHLRGGQDGH